MSNTNTDSDQLDKEAIIQQTERWIKSFIIHYNICPFAEKVVIEKKIEYKVIPDSDVATCLEALIDEIIRLDSSTEIETTLLIFPEVATEFDDYLEFLDIANQLIEDQGLDDDFQIASFHPGYCFHGEAKNDAANFTNRSPWPMLHIIRQSSIEKALQFYKNPELIPEHNIKLTRDLGYELLSQLREQCMRPE